MADAEQVDGIRRLVRAHLPGCDPGRVVPWEAGTDNVAYRVGEELVVRVSKQPPGAARAARIAAEARVLSAVATLSPLPVPVVRFAVPEEGCLAYRRLPGAPLIDRPAAERARYAEPIARRLGALLTALHAAPPEPLRALVEPDDVPLTDWRDEAADHYAAVASAIPAHHRAAAEAFLASAPPAAAYAPVFSHNDLGIEHVLVDGPLAAVTGILDWSDAAIVDPAVDFGRVLRDLGPAALDAALAAYPRAADGIRERAAFYARCGVLEDLAYGLETGRARYVEKCLAALPWLFPG